MMPVSTSPVAGRRQRARSGGVEVHRRAVVDERVASLEQRRHAGSFDELAQPLDAFAVANRTFSGEPRELARVRRHDRGLAAQNLEVLREVKERARVDDGRQRLRARNPVTMAPVRSSSPRPGPIAIDPLRFEMSRRSSTTSLGRSVVGKFDDDLFDEMRAQQICDAARVRRP